jgi:hypothetical protein
MRARLERLESRAEQKRTLVTTALQEAGIRKLVAPDFTAYLRLSPARLIVTDKSLVRQIMGGAAARPHRPCSNPPSASAAPPPTATPTFSTFQNQNYTPLACQFHS